MWIDPQATVVKRHESAPEVAQYLVALGAVQRRQTLHVMPSDRITENAPSLASAASASEPSGS